MTTTINSLGAAEERVNTEQEEQADALARLEMASFGNGGGAGHSSEDKTPLLLAGDRSEGDGLVADGRADSQVVPPAPKRSTLMTVCPYILGARARRRAFAFRLTRGRRWPDGVRA